MQNVAMEVAFKIAEIPKSYKRGSLVVVLAPLVSQISYLTSYVVELESKYVVISHPFSSFHRFLGAQIFVYISLLINRAILQRLHCNRTKKKWSARSQYQTYLHK